MTQTTLAIIVGDNDTRYKLKGWRYGSTRRSKPKRPAQLFVLTDESGWEHLETWTGARTTNGQMKKPKPDTQVLFEALEHLEHSYGVQPEQIVLHEPSEFNTLHEPLGWGYDDSSTDFVNAEIKIVTG